MAARSKQNDAADETDTLTRKGKYKLNKELETLMAQKREIEQKIKALKQNEIICGRAKFFGTDIEDEYRVQVSYNTNMPRYRGERMRWTPIIRRSEKSEVISDIQEVIESLTELKNKISEE